MPDSPASTVLDEALQSILAAIRSLDAIHDPGQLPLAIVDAATSLLQVTNASLWLHEGSELVLRAPGSTPPQRLKPDTGALQALIAGNTFPTAIASAMASTNGEPSAAGTPAELCVPLQGQGGLVGVLELRDAGRASFDARTTLHARVLASYCSTALRLSLQESSIRHARHLHAEAETARGIQRSTLPTRMPHIPGYDLHGHFQPATYAGGDLFDVALLEPGLFLLLGDATGHGFGPALSATQMQGMLRVAFRLGADLDRAYLQVNNQLAEDLPDDRFVTAFMGFLDPQAHSVGFHAAGQPIVHFHAADHRCEWIAPTTFPVGVLPLAQAVASQRLQLEPGDILALVSDGVYEQPGPGSADFGQQRVCDIVCSGHSLPMQALSDRLLAAVGEFAAGVAQADDITIVLARRLP
ncbi:MAG TPA: SpoIIE family protein phosphatase [Lysobacter sp.]|nr:SpoIIE family protein phosphatase [Lysobacter sp.]